jgi:sec-independent protein translocase protein TatA
MFSHWELIVLLVVVLLIFGPSQLPKLAKGIGTSIKSFKDGMKDADKKEGEKGETKGAAEGPPAPDASETKDSSVKP